jgi:putative transposase
MRFQTATATIAGIKVDHMIRKDRFTASGTTRFQHFAALAS